MHIAMEKVVTAVNPSYWVSREFVRGPQLLVVVALVGGLDDIKCFLVNDWRDGLFSCVWWCR